ncbi:MAG: hypothetical protein QXR63_07580 [Candidatus Bathyarchaeia archaeon]
MKGSCMLLMVFMAVTFMPLWQATANSSSDVEIVGFHIKDFTVVNGTVEVSFEIKSETPVESVVLSYINYEEKLVNVTLSLTEGNANNGLWSATVKPKVFEEKEGNEVTTSIKAEKLYIFLTNNEVIEKTLGALMLMKKTVETRIAIVFPWLLGIIEIAAAAGLASVLVILKKRKNKEKVKEENAIESS